LKFKILNNFLLCCPQVALLPSDQMVISCIYLQGIWELRVQLKTIYTNIEDWPWE
jgi:hypothetical protein